MPNVQALARQGVTFTRAYSETPVCYPARANLLVGQSSARTQIVDWFGVDLKAAITADRWSYDTSFASWINLRSLAVGKYLNDNDAMNPIGWSRFRQPQDAHAHVVTSVNEGAGFHAVAPTWHTEWEVSEISSHLGAGPGWLVFWCSNSPHEPHRADPNGSDPWSGGLALEEYEQNGTDWPAWITAKRALTDVDWSEARMVRRGTIIEAVEWDRAFGSVMESIDIEDTLVIVSSDNGLHHGDHRIAGLAAKNTLYEAASGIPLIVAGPGFPVGRTVDSLVNLIDITATITAATGDLAPHSLDGIDLALITANPSEYSDRAVLGRRKAQLGDYPPCDWIVTQTRKLGRHDVGGATVYEMYDLDTDAGELVNVADEPERLEERVNLEAQLDGLLTEKP